MEIGNFLSHLKEVASSPYALVAYISLVAAWVYVASAQYRLKTISKVLRNLPEEHRADVLLREYNTTPRAGLSAEQWIRARRHTLLLITFLSTLIALLIIALLALSRAKTDPASTHRDAHLSLVDLVVTTTNEFPTIEFKLRNNSDEVIFIKRAGFLTIERWDLPNYGLAPHAVPVSWTYDVRVSDNAGEVTIHNISQAIGPNSVDRFMFRIRPDSDKIPYPGVGIFAYLLRIKLIYNEDDKELESPNILMHIPPAWTIGASMNVRPPLKALEKNKELAKDILKKVDANTVYPKGLLDAVKSWANADFSELVKH